MCGIVGSFQPGGDGTAATDVIARMRDRMAHRGPDGVGLWTLGRSRAARSATAGCRSSICPTPAAQPMVNAAGTVALTFNGEIYNHADVRRELAGARQVRSGRPIIPTPRCCCTPTRSGASTASSSSTACSRSAIYDARDPGRPVLHLIRDRVGIKPIYFTQDQRAANGCSRRRSARCSRIRT